MSLDITVLMALAQLILRFASYQQCYSFVHATHMQFAKLNKLFERRFYICRNIVPTASLKTQITVKIS